MEAQLGVAERFGKNLLRVRRQVGFSQEEVGLRASLHRTEIGLLERGARVPRIDTLVKLAAALGAPIECPLLEGIEWQLSRTQAGAFSVSRSEGEVGSAPEAG